MRHVDWLVRSADIYVDHSQLTLQLIRWGMRDMELSKRKKSPELTTNRHLRAEILVTWLIMFLFLGHATIYLWESVTGGHKIDHR